MRKCVVTGDNLIIGQFNNVFWKKEIGQEKLICELKNIEGVRENLERNGCWYRFDDSEQIICAFLANIGKVPHPLIELSYVSSWYKSNLGGVYLIGKDKKTGALFAPVVYQKLPSL